MNYPRIDKVDADQRPFWSVMIPVRNKPDFIADTINSVLSNNISADDMQIEVIDNSTFDCGVKQIVDDLGKGRIAYYKQPKDLSMAENWNSCVNRAIGKYVHILHDDDYIAPTFYSEFYDFIKQKPDCGFYCCSSVFVDNKGLIVNDKVEPKELLNENPDIKKIALSSTIYTPGVVVRRKCYVELGGFDLSFVFVLDMQMWIRIIIKFKGAFLRKKLAYYRYSEKNETCRIFAEGKNINDERKFLLFLRDNGIRLTNSEINKLLIDRVYKQYLRFKENGDYVAAKKNYDIFLNYTNAFYRIYYKSINSRFYRLKVKYYIPRFIFYLVHPWQIIKYINRISSNSKNISN
jgi:hypothetical protein